MAVEDFYIFLTGTKGGAIDPRKGRVDDLQLGGQEVPEGDVKQMEEFQGITERTGVKLNRWAWFGSVLSDLPVTNAFKKLTAAAGYVPRVSRLIIYGYSAGGKNALKLCREFDATAVSVDLLVTVDAAAWDESDKMDRRLGKCVRWNLNYWQESGGLSGSHGAPNQGDKSAQKIEEYKRSEAHSDINNAVRDEAKKKIQEVLNAPSTEVSLIGQWDVVIGDWRGLLVFDADWTASWQETDPQRRKADSKVHFGRWWEDGAAFKWEYRDDRETLGWERTFVAPRPLGKTVKGQARDKKSESEKPRGLFEMTKR